MKLRELWNNSSEILANQNIENGRADARLLLMHTFNYNYTEFILNLEQDISENQIDQYQELLDQYQSGQPLQYILGKQEFMGLEFIVNNNVLIPRGDTEILVKQVLTKVNPQQNINIADIGTGSGAIAITLASYLKNARFVAVDISSNALEVAKINAKKHLVSDRIEFIKGDLLDPLLLTTKRYDIVISNPPYISTEEMEFLPQNVMKEPHLALVGGPDGLDFYRRLAVDSPKILIDGGYLMVEIGSGQSVKVERIFSKNGFKDVEVFNDFAKLPRVVIGKLKKPL